MDQGKFSTGANLLRLSTLGMNFALSIFVGLFMGWGVHKLFHLGNWIIMAGMILGIISSYVLLFQDLKALNASADDKSHGSQS